jgi:hypothetical protein
MAATSDPARDEFVPDVEALQALHSELMTKYLAVLAEASTWGESSEVADWGAKPPVHEGRDGWRVLINRLVEAHIKKRLALLGSAYLQLGGALCTVPDNPHRNWLEAASKSCTEIADSLHSWKRPGLLAVISPAIAVGTVVAKTPWRSVTSIYAQVVGVLVVFAALFFVAFRDSYREKRRLFLWGYVPRGAEPSDPIRNIYLTEDQLFALIRRHKPKEWSLDGVAYALYFGVLAGLIVWFFAVNPGGLILIAGFGAFMFAMLAITVWSEWLRHRVPHSKWR